MDILSTGLTLLLIMDPLRNFPLFLSVLKTVDVESRKRQILIRELCFALLVLLKFFICRSKSFTMIESEAGSCEPSWLDSALFDFYENDIRIVLTLYWKYIRFLLELY